MDNAKDAYSFAKDTGLEKPLIDVSKGFIKWFGGLFTRKAHKERVKLMEELKASENDLVMLKSELEVQIEENENLKNKFQEKIATMQETIKKSDNQEAIKIIRSKNVVAGVKKIEVKGDFHVGDNYSDKKQK